ncbi:MAG: hypothetical protein KDA68_18805 [Planctomycetaceae bacterium]|nr:hypothetical protein [Planctomycetaceae bacterium]
MMKLHAPNAVSFDRMLEFGIAINCRSGKAGACPIKSPAFMGWGSIGILAAVLNLRFSFLLKQESFCWSHSRKMVPTASMESDVDSEHLNEYFEVRTSAYNALRFGTLIERHRSVPVCQLLILPSFENPVSWDVVKVVSRKEDAQTRLHRSTWRMDVDCRVMSSPIERLKNPRPYLPTLETEWLFIDAAKLENVLSKLRSIRIPLLIAGTQGGLDGTSFELAVGEFSCNARIRWWCDMPKEWQELASVVAELDSLFQETWKRGRG